MGKLLEYLDFMRIPTRSATVTIALALGMAGCSGSDDGPAQGIAQTPPSLNPSGCTIPEPPALSETAQVVGDGSAGSCTIEALRAALDVGGTITFSCGAAPGG